MKPEIKKMWVDALRSGEYRQCRKRLKNGGSVPSFCCLGVLRELAPEDIRKEKNDNPETLSSSIMKWAGLKNCDPNIKPGEKGGMAYEGRATYLNDNLGYSFNQIADLIEENL